MTAVVVQPAVVDAAVLRLIVAEVTVEDSCARVGSCSVDISHTLCHSIVAYGHSIGKICLLEHLCIARDLAGIEHNGTVAYYSIAAESNCSRFPAVVIDPAASVNYSVAAYNGIIGSCHLICDYGVVLNADIAFQHRISKHHGIGSHIYGAVHLGGVRYPAASVGVSVSPALLIPCGIVDISAVHSDLIGVSSALVTVFVCGNVVLMEGVALVESLGHCRYRKVSGSRSLCGSCHGLAVTEQIGVGLFAVSVNSYDTSLPACIAVVGESAEADGNITACQLQRDDIYARLHGRLLLGNAVNSAALPVGKSIDKISVKRL